MTKFKAGDIVRVVDVNGAFRKPPPNLITKISRVNHLPHNLNNDIMPPPMAIFGPGNCGHIVYPYNVELVKDKQTLFIYYMVGPYIDEPDFETDLYIEQYRTTYSGAR